jgi:hypothetical protein
MIESNKAQIVLASIEIILKPSEQEMLQVHLRSTTCLREVNNDIQEAAEDADRAQLDTTTVLDSQRAKKPAHTPIT